MHPPIDAATASSVIQQSHPAVQQLKTVVREALPSAGLIRVETSDQQTGYGFFLIAVSTADGRPLHVCDDLFAQASDILADVEWGAVIGEDAHGYATLRI